MYSGEARRVRSYIPVDLARERQAALDRQVALFGTDAWPSPQVPGFDALIDQPIDSFSIEEEPSGFRLHLMRPLVLEEVDKNAPALPAQVSGWVEPTDRVARTPAVIAVALNGRIVTCTQTVPGQAAFSAILPPARLKDGPNRLEAFLVRADRPHQLFGSRPAPGPPDANLIMPNASAWGVEQSGLHRPEKGGATVFRWTDGSAVLDVPILPERPPSALELALGHSGPVGKKLRVRVDGCEVMSETLKAGGWSRTVMLETCTPRGYWARIELQSDTHRPGRDTRRLGVAVQRVVLR
jgi:hypothetical protein